MKQFTCVIKQSEIIVEQPRCNLSKNSGEDKPDVRQSWVLLLSVVLVHILENIRNRVGIYL